MYKIHPAGMFASGAGDNDIDRGFNDGAWSTRTGYGYWKNKRNLPSMPSTVHSSILTHW